MSMGLRSVTIAPYPKRRKNGAIALLLEWPKFCGERLPIEGQNERHRTACWLLKWIVTDFECLATYLDYRGVR